jgi:hypothetical protein
VTWVTWNLISIGFETVLASVQHRCLVFVKRTIGIEIIVDELDGLLGDESQVNARFGPFGDSATLDAGLVHGLCRTYRRLENSIRGTRWNSNVMWVKSNPISICV